MTPTNERHQTGPPAPLPRPVADTCEACGATGPGLSAHEADTEVGVLCLTLCPACATEGRTPRFSCVGSAYRVLEHCGHTGRRLDDNREATRYAAASGEGGREPPADLPALFRLRTHPAGLDRIRRHRRIRRA